MHFYDRDETTRRRRPLFCDYECAEDCEVAVGGRQHGVLLRVEKRVAGISEGYRCHGIRM